MDGPKKVKKFKCTRCSRKNFKSRDALQQHRRDTGHVEDPNLTCSKCPSRVFVLVDALKQHCRDAGHSIRRANTTAVPSKLAPLPANPALAPNTFNCNVCLRGFATRPALEQHRVDTGHRPRSATPSTTSSDDIQGALLADAFQHLNINTSTSATPHRCGTCPNRIFTSEHSLTQHCESTGHQKLSSSSSTPAEVYPQTDPTTVSLAICSSCPNRIFASLGAANQHCNATGHTLELQTSPRQGDAIDQFFARFPHFAYHPDQPYHRQFKALAKIMGWSKKHKCRTEFREAMVRAFGTDFKATAADDLAERLEAWQELCRAVGEETVPDGIKGCKEIICNTYVNLLDLHEYQRNPSTVPRPTRFDSEEELREYTRATNRYFPKEDAYAEGLLKWLLRQIKRKYRGFRGMKERRARA